MKVYIHLRLANANEKESEKQWETNTLTMVRRARWRESMNISWINQQEARAMKDGRAALRLIDGSYRI